MRTALLLSVLIAIPALADEEVTHTFSSSLPRSGIRRVIVDIPAGELSLRNGSADRIGISGKVWRDYDGYRQRAKEQGIVDDIGVEIFTNGDEALIRRSFGPKAQSWSARTWHTNYRITVEVPRGTDVNFEMRYGELSLEGDFGNLNADLRAGEIHMRVPRASVHELNASVRIGEVHTDFGVDREDHEGILPGSTHFINTSGRSRINLHTTVGELHVTLTR
ncbi:MAG TPA: hypothetical protein VER58_21880 [Thermoanaerobaculia bacterium]|nr:hypothetical protein [Thermoanaerobaculia bacterium]